VGLSGCAAGQSANRPSLIYFRAANCPYCKQMTPVVNDVERAYGRQLAVTYAEVDSQEGKDLAKHHGIIGYPTILLLDSEGERIGLLRGVVPRSSLEQMIEELLASQG
jgi:thioredoxin 1